jgi:ribosomal protein S18 acetylase RimI-like enzyme
MPTYTTLVIPTSLSEESLTLLAQKLRTFKLHALLSDPNAFSQSHAAESQLPPAAWEARVADSDFRIVVCIVDACESLGLPSVEGGSSSDLGDQEVKGQDSTVQRLLAGEWAGTFTLVGPVARSAWLCPGSGQPAPAADGAETRWHLTSLFVLPEHRGQGLAAKLTRAAVQAGSAASSALSRESGSQEAFGDVRAPTRFRLIVHPNNKPVVGLYEKLGFVVGGLYTQREAMAAMGDAAGVPADADGEKWDTRFGIGMEYLI